MHTEIEKKPREIFLQRAYAGVNEVAKRSPKNKFFFFLLHPRRNRDLAGSIIPQVLPAVLRRPARVSRFHYDSAFSMPLLSPSRVSRVARALFSFFFYFFFCFYFLPYTDVSAYICIRGDWKGSFPFRLARLSVRIRDVIANSRANVWTGWIVLVISQVDDFLYFVVVPGFFHSETKQRFTYFGEDLKSLMSIFRRIDLV